MANPTNESAQASSLTDYLLARIAEDEAAAHLFETHFRLLRDESGRPLSETEPFPPRMTYARARAECEAKCAIVKMHVETDDYDYEGMRFSTGCGECIGIDQGYGKPWPCPTLRAVAAPYADRDDFNGAWLADD